MSGYRAPADSQGAGRRPGVKLLPALGTAGLLLCAVCAAAAVRLAAEPGQGKDEAQGNNTTTVKAVAAAKAFLDTLDEQQRGKVLFDYGSGKKSGWSNLPVTMVPRNGIRLGDLSKEQRTAALNALAAVLSKEGYQKAIDIMNADDQLIAGKVNKMKFGTENFYLAIFGKPSPTQPWMLQFGGHHLGLNVTVAGNNAVLTPSHTGVQPPAFTRNGKTVRPLGPENDLAFRLINLLDKNQQAQAIRGAKPKNLLLGPGQDGKTIPPEGIKGSALTEAQRALLLELIGAWVHILPDAAATVRLAEIKGKLTDTYFAWYGPTANGSAAYYRVQGPTLVIEYAPQGGTNHIHTIIRDPSNDYGKQLTKS